MKPSENKSKGCSETGAWEREHGDLPAFDFSKTFSESRPWRTSLLMMWDLREMSSPQSPYTREGRYLSAAPKKLLRWAKKNPKNQTLLHGEDFRDEKVGCDHVQGYY